MLLIESGLNAYLNGEPTDAARFSAMSLPTHSCETLRPAGLVQMTTGLALRCENGSFPTYAEFSAQAASYNQSFVSILAVKLSCQWMFMLLSLAARGSRYIAHLQRD